MTGLSSVWPCARPVEIGECVVLVPPIRLRDLAELEQRCGELDLTGPDPEPLDDPYRHHCRQWAIWRNWPAPVGSPHEAVRRHGLPGLALVLAIVGPRCSPPLGGPESVLAVLTVDQAAKLLDAIGGDHPARVSWHALNHLDDLHGPPTSAKTALQAIWELACESGMTLDQIGEIPVCVWNSLGGGTQGPKVSSVREKRMKVVDEVMREFGERTESVSPMGEI